jgi:signal transduction histidine kinase
LNAILGYARMLQTNAIARQLAELHGGTIQASSEGSGKGSTFTIRLPCVDAGRADAASEEV